MRGCPLTRTLAVAGLAVVCAAPAARAQSGQRAAVQVFEDYRTDGAIDPCAHSAAKLQLALDTVPPDIEQYAAEYPAAIEGAIEARGRGECSGGGSPGGAGAGGAPQTPGAAAPTAPGATATPVPTAAPWAIGPTSTVVPEPPAPATAGTPAGAQRADPALERAASGTASNPPPLPVLLLGVLLALAALAALAVALLRSGGVADDRLAPAAHAWREAAWRAGGTWADFRDWLRLGR